jgi:hypothetical protein
MMTAFNDYVTAGLRVFEEWRPRLQERLGRKSHTFPGESGDTPPGQVPDESGSPTETVPVQVSLPVPLDQILAQSGKLPPHSLLLGVCDDGLPFLLDLTNPAPGALLICGDPGVGKTVLMDSILASGLRLNTPSQLNLSVIAAEIEPFMHLAKAEHCQEIFSVGEEVTGDLIGELADLAEERRRTRPTDPAILLVIDDLAGCLDHLDQQAFSRLYWLIRHGPRSRIWTVASLSMERARTIEPQFLSAFRTRLFGRTADRKLVAQLSDDDKLRTARLENGQFNIPYGGEWLRLWACPVDDELVDQPEGGEA